MNADDERVAGHYNNTGFDFESVRLSQHIFRLSLLLSLHVRNSQKLQIAIAPIPKLNQIKKQYRVSCRA